MKEHLCLGSAPFAERCVQTIEPGYLELAQAECRRYLGVLKAFYTSTRGSIPSGLVFKVRENSHDFGIYLDVVAEFDSSDQQAADAALWLEHNMLENWPVG